MKKIKLLDYQEQILKKTAHLDRCAYYLDMGLGKTFVGSEKLAMLNMQFALIVCQKAKVEDWVEHMKEHYKIKTLNLTNKKQYVEFLDNIKNNIPQVGVVNYDIIYRRKELLTELKNNSEFAMMIDESSLLANNNSKRSKTLIDLSKYARGVVLLSGTCCNGKYENLYTQIKILGYNINKAQYWDKFIVYENMDFGTSAYPIKLVKGYKRINELTEMLNEKCVFLKSEEVLNLPKQIFKTVKNKNIAEYKKFLLTKQIKTDDEDDITSYHTLTDLLYCRQLTSIIYNKHKLANLKALLESTDKRVLIFYNFKDECEILKEICVDIEKPISEINGDCKNIDNYNHCQNSVTLCQYQSASMGLNLQLANIIIYASLPLDSTFFEQSKKRIHRLGQEKSCFYYILETENSIDADIYDTLKERKNYTDALFKKNILKKE